MTGTGHPHSGNFKNLKLRTSLDDVDFMPTRLGNVLKTSEVYAYDRYFNESNYYLGLAFFLFYRQDL